MWFEEMPLTLCQKCNTNKTRNKITCKVCIHQQCLEKELQKMCAIPDVGTACDGCGDVGRLHPNHDPSTGLYRGHLCRYCSQILDDVDDGFLDISYYFKQHDRA